MLQLCPSLEWSSLGPNRHVVVPRTKDAATRANPCGLRNRGPTQDRNRRYPGSAWRGIPGIRRATCIVLAISSASPLSSPPRLDSFATEKKTASSSLPVLCGLWLLCASPVAPHSSLSPLTRHAGGEGTSSGALLRTSAPPLGLAVAAPAGVADRRRRPRCWRTRLPSCCRSTSATTFGGSTRRR
jgi:hypothetical protein